MIAMVAGPLVVALPSAAVQLIYAMALSGVVNAPDDAPEACIECACSRQRSLWVVTAVVMWLGAVVALLRTPAVFFCTGAAGRYRRSVASEVNDPTVEHEHGGGEH